MKPQSGLIGLSATTGRSDSEAAARVEATGTYCRRAFFIAMSRLVRAIRLIAALAASLRGVDRRGGGGLVDILHDREVDAPGSASGRAMVMSRLACVTTRRGCGADRCRRRPEVTTISPSLKGFCPTPGSSLDRSRRRAARKRRGAVADEERARAGGVGDEKDARRSARSRAPGRSALGDRLPGRTPPSCCRERRREPRLESKVEPTIGRCALS
jgi:hypothetical protein